MKISPGPSEATPPKIWPTSPTTGEDWRFQWMVQRSKSKISPRIESSVRNPNRTTREEPVDETHLIDNENAEDQTNQS